MQLTGCEGTLLASWAMAAASVVVLAASGQRADVQCRREAERHCNYAIYPVAAAHIDRLQANVV